MWLFCEAGPIGEALEIMGSTKEYSLSGACLWESSRPVGFRSFVFRRQPGYLDIQKEEDREQLARPIDFLVAYALRK